MTIKKIKAIMNDNELNKLNHNFDYLSESQRRIQTQINDLVLDAGESNQEVVQARGGHRVLNDRLNSIDSQLAQTIEQTPVASKTNIDYYVSPNGNDENSGSSTEPFATLSKAVSMLPDMIRKDHIYTINLLEGVWDEELNLEHILVYGKLRIKGTTGNRENHKVYRVTGESLLGHTIIENITTTVKNAVGQSFRFRRCSPHVEVINCKAESDPSIEKGVTGVIGLLADYGSQVYVRNFECSGKRYAIRSNYLSRIFSTDNTGSNNTFGVGARWGGIVALYGTQPTGDKNDTTDSGGILSYGIGGRIGVPRGANGLVQSIGQGDYSPSIKKYHITSNNFNLSGTDIPTGKQLRMRFRQRQEGYLKMNIRYGGQTSNTSGQGVEVIYSGLMKLGNFDRSRKTIVFEDYMKGDAIEIAHTGSNGIFDVIVRPLSAIANRWGIEIDTTIFRQHEAPELLEFIYENSTATV